MKDRLKNLRITNNLSQETLANMMEVSRSCVSGWERGSRSPDVGQLYKYYRLFSLKKNHFDDLVRCEIASPCKAFDLTILNSRGVKRLYDFYQKLAASKKYLKNP